jgi:hypothetical protein
MTTIMKSYKLLLPLILLILLPFAGCSISLPTANASPDIIYSTSDGYLLHNPEYGGYSYPPSPSSMDVGDYYWILDTAYIRRGYVKFDLTGISGCLSSARMYLYVMSSTTDGVYYGSSPLQNPGLGDCWIQHIDDYGTVDHNDWDDPSIGNDPGTLISSGTNPDVGYISIDVTAAMQDDINNVKAYSAFVIRFANNRDNDDKNDHFSFVTSWYNGHDPYIEYNLSPCATGEATDSTGNIRNGFITKENVYATGNNFPPSTPVNIYVVNDHPWIDGMGITFDVSGDGRNTATTDALGNLGPVLIWPSPLTVGSYDVVFDVEQNGVYNKAIDVVDHPNHPGFTVSSFDTGSVAVGGFYIPADRLAILAPYLILAYLIGIVTSVLLTRKRRKN